MLQLPRLRNVLVFSLFIGVPGCPFFPSLGAAVELRIPISTPNLRGVTAEIPIGGSKALLEASFRYDAKGKVIGEAHLDGEPMTVKGGLKKSRSGFTYKVKLSGTSSKTTLNMNGVVGSGLASITYSGSRGKAKLASFPIELLTSAESSGGLITADVAVDAKGKISGTGRFTSGFGNDPEAAGALKGKFSGTTLTLSFKAGKQSISFKGSLQGDAFVGTLKIKAPPAKETVQSFTVPLGNGIEIPPPSDGDDHSSGAMERGYKFIQLDSPPGNAYFGGGLSINDVTTRSGARTRWGWIDLSNGETFLRNPEEVEFSPNELLPPAREGVWFSTTLYSHTYDMREHKLKKGARAGTFSMTVSAVDGELISGTWEFRSDQSGRPITGTWQTTQRPDGI